MPASKNIVDIVNKYPNVELDEACWSSIGPGWLPLFEELIQKLSAMPGQTCKIEQVKEKFGELRIYSKVIGVPFDSHENSEHQKLVNQYEIKSRHICETCGSSGKIRDCFSDGTPRGWIKCLCETCNQPKKKV